MEREETGGGNINRLWRALSRLGRAARDVWLTIAVFVVFSVLFASVVSIVILGYIRSWKWTGVIDKTFWDWLKLMIVPIVLGAGGYSVVRAFAWSDQAEQQQRTQQALREAQNTSRQASLDQISLEYINRMESLLTEYDLAMQPPDGNLRVLARARTLNVLEALDPRRRASTVRFLYDARLIGVDDPVIPLAGANLRESDLAYSIMARADLSRVDLGEANLEGANLELSNLEFANLYAANLTWADLEGANLEGANLEDASLRSAYLRNTSLKDAYLINTDLTEASVDPEQLVEQARSLEGTIMPDGQKYEDWLKS
jgi:uncharacterized protein YjbI with pentapeptide repeats